jgi:Fe-S-cluster containining protein
MDHEAALGAVRAVYEALEERPVERQCVSRSECCRFRLTGKTPYLTAGEALVLADFLRRTGRARLESKRDGSCPLLNEVTGRCEAYSARPFGCRTHFCEAAGGPYSRKEVVDLIRRLEAVDEALFGEGARALEIALREALQRPPVRGRPR